MHTREVEAGISTLASRQHGVFALHQLEELGLSGRAVQKRAVSGRLHRLYRGVYALTPPSLLNREARWLAAVLACGRGAVLSHRSAAALHALRPHGGARIDVTSAVAPRGGRAIRVHRCGELAPDDVTCVRGVPCTAVARTLLDLAGVLDRRGLERACDQAEILGVFDLGAVSQQLKRHPRRRGSPNLRAVLTDHHIGTTPTWSELEERFLQLVREAALPVPEVNAWVDPDDGEPPFRVDFLWREQRLIVETDGRATHRTPQAFELDRRRDQRLTAAGWRPVRFTWRQLEREGAAVRATLVALLVG